MKDIYKIIMVIMGTLIGAGFASGREIYIFFGQYGIKGLFGIAFSAIITGFIIYKTLSKVLKKNIYNYEELLYNINKNHDLLNKIIKIIVNSFLLVSFLIMVAAFSAYINQNFGIQSYISSGIFTLICYIVFEKSLNGMMKINSILVPFMIFFILIIGVKNIFSYRGSINVQNNLPSYMCIFSSILYASYNSIILVPVLACMKNYITNKKQVKLVSYISSIIIIILSILIFLILSREGIQVKKLELPISHIIKNFGEKYFYIYSFIIIVSIFTSAISAGYSFLKNVSKTEKMYKLNLILICIASIFVSKIGFTNLVSFFYPFFRNSWNITNDFYF